MENNLTKHHLAPAAQVPGPQFERNLPFLPLVHGFLLQLPNTLNCLYLHHIIALHVSSMSKQYAIKMTLNHMCPEFLCEYARCALSKPSFCNSPGITPIKQTVFAYAGIQGSKSACCKRTCFLFSLLLLPTLQNSDTRTLSHCHMWSCS